MDARITYRSNGESNGAYGIEAGSPSGISTTLILARLWRRKWLIAVSSTILLALFSAMLALLPVKYTAETEVVVEQRPQSVDLAAVLSRIPTDSQAVLTEAEAFRSRGLVQRTIAQLNLLTRPEFNPRILPEDDSLRSRWRRAKAAAMDAIGSLLRKSDGKGHRPGDPDLNEATEIFLAQLRVTPIGRSQVLRASFTSENPELASEVLNELVRLYLATQMETRVAVPTKMGDFLKPELDKLQEKVRAANDAVERYRNEAQLQQGVAAGKETLLYTHELTEANRELVTVRLKRQEAEARLAEVRTNPNAVTDVLSNVLIQQLHGQLSVLKDARSQIASTYGPHHPNLRQLEKSIAEAEGRLNAEVAKIGRSLASEAAVQSKREAQLLETIADLKDKVQKAGRARVVLASLEQEAEVNRSLLTTLLTQYNQLKSQRALQIADSYVLAPADVPTQPSFPPTVPLLGLAFVVSVGLSSLGALLLERTGHTIRSAQEVQPLLTVRLLGIVPKLESTARLLTQVIDSPQSAFTESIRSILARLMVPRNLGRVVLVASAQSREGRTSLAIALARLAALSGRRAILIDCNLRYPAIHGAFGTKIGTGLTDLLQNRIDLRAALRKDTLTPLDYITGGNLAPDAANLLCSPEMAELLVKLRSEYDLLILDSPPSSTVADASLIAQLADECLFVVGWNKTPWRLVREQVEELSYQCSVTGVVLNQVDMRKHLKYQDAYIGPPRAPVMIGSAG